MFLSPNSIIAEPNWQDTIQRGDVVLFRFPIDTDGELTPPKRRPCLVLDVRKIGDSKFVTLAYGCPSSEFLGPKAA